MMKDEKSERLLMAVEEVEGHRGSAWLIHSDPPAASSQDPDKGLNYYA